MFHGHLDSFQKPPLGSRPSTKPRDQDPAWIEIYWNGIWLRARSHMTSHYTWGFMITLHDFEGVLGRPLDTFSWALTISRARLLAHVVPMAMSHASLTFTMLIPLKNIFYFTRYLFPQIESSKCQSSHQHISHAEITFWMLNVKLNLNVKCIKFKVGWDNSFESIFHFNYCPSFIA